MEADARNGFHNVYLDGIAEAPEAPAEDIKKGGDEDPD
jgi:hypothetical protein